MKSRVDVPERQIAIWFQPFKVSAFVDDEINPVARSRYETTPLVIYSSLIFEVFVSNNPHLEDVEVGYAQNSTVKSPVPGAVAVLPDIPPLVVFIE